MPIDLRPYQLEIEQGLPTASREMDLAAERQAFYDYDGTRYERRFRRDAESSFDFQGRSHRSSGFLTACLDILCEHCYSPGPARRWSEAAGNDFLQRVYADNLIDALMLEADLLSSLNQFCAIQIDPAKGTALKPITYRLWGREELAVWTDPDDRNEVQVVITKDKFNEQIRYRLWTDEVVQTYLTKPLGRDQTAGGRVAYPDGPPIQHGYGCMPFSFVCYRLPIRGFPACGVSVRAVGEFLCKAEWAIDDRLMSMDESYKKYLNPLPVAEGMPQQWKPDLEPGRFIRIPRANPVIDGKGGYAPGEFARLYYLQAAIDLQGGWLDLQNYINLALQDARVPLSAARMEQSGVASGISLMVEQEPLLRRAEKRRQMYRVYETDLSKRTLCVAGNHYGRPELLAALEAPEAKLVAAWPRPRLAISTMDTLELGVAKVQSGLSSHLMLIQDDYGCDREEALELARQIAQDKADLMAVNPDLVGPTQPIDPNEEKDEVEGKDEDGEDKKEDGE